MLRAFYSKPILEIGNTLGALNVLGLFEFLSINNHSQLFTKFPRVALEKIIPSDH